MKVPYKHPVQSWPIATNAGFEFISILANNLSAVADRTQDYTSQCNHDNSCPFMSERTLFHSISQTISMLSKLPENTFLLFSFFFPFPSFLLESFWSILLWVSHFIKRQKISVVALPGMVRFRGKSSEDLWHFCSTCFIDKYTSWTQVEIKRVYRVTDLLPHIRSPERETDPEPHGA